MRNGWMDGGQKIKSRVGKTHGKEQAKETHRENMKKTTEKQTKTNRLLSKEAHNYH